MAWQLIYTSAPRLLEAGRTGFGTVARHRAVSGMLASSVERFSQFARLSGHDPRRIIYACRILTVGSGSYHVLSCLQDAGSDYTGRTNHIAHHLIVEPREARTLAAAGITPADVLHGMHWRRSWTDGPRYLDAAEEVDLSVFKAPASRAWSSITGSQASAGVLWSRDVLKGCYLITPAGVNTLELFQESLQQETAQAWQCRFTTCLEPTDDPADFRWIALPDSSPLRSQVENSSRTLLDLTNPSTLPLPPEPEQQPVSPESTALPPPQASFPLPAAQQKKVRQESPASQTASTLGNWAPESNQKRTAAKGKNYIDFSLLVAAVLILIVGGGLILKFHHQKQQHLAEDAYVSAIAKAWREYDLLLDDTRRFLESQTSLETGQSLLQSHRDFFQGMRKVLNQPEEQIDLPLPNENRDDLRSFSLLLKEWTALHNDPWNHLRPDQGPSQAAKINETLGKWQEARANLWRHLRAYVSLKISPPPADALIKKLKEIAKDSLRSTPPALNSRREWEQLFELTEEGSVPVDAEVKKWLTTWAALDGPGGYAAAQQTLADMSLPEWLRTLAAGVKPPAMRVAVASGSTKPAGKEKPKLSAPEEDADSPTGISPIFIHLLQSGEAAAGKITGLPVEAGMQLYVGASRDVHPPPDGQTETKDGELKRWAHISLDGRNDLMFGPKITAAAVDTLTFSETGSLTSLPESYRLSPDGIRMVARDKDGMKVLFDLRILPLSSSATRPVFARVIEATADNATSTTLNLPAGFLGRLHLAGASVPEYSLRREGSVSEQKIFSLRKSGDSNFEVMPPQMQSSFALERNGLERQIKELEAGIVKDNADLAALETSKATAREKDIRRDNYTKARSDKEIKLRALQDRLQSISGQSAVHFDLMPGDYTLVVATPDKVELCKLRVIPAATSNSKPVNP